MNAPKNQIDPNAIPGVGVAKEVKMETVELKNVLFGDNGQENITVKVVPFNRRDDDHVEFAYAYSDMLYRAPSPFKTVSDAAREYVRLFMVHTKEDEAKADSIFSRIYGDLRACRTLFHQNNIQQALNDFFENA